MKLSKKQFTGIVLLAQVVVLAVLVLAWQGATATGITDTFFYSSPALVGRSLLRILRTGVLWEHVGVTLYETLAGFLVGGVLGVACGLAVSRNEFLLRVSNPFIYFAYSLPRIALAPLFVVILGLGLLSKVATVVFTVFFILLINTLAGVKNIQPLWIQSAQIMGGSPAQISLRIVIPGVLTWIFAGIRVAASLAFASAVVGEFAGSTRGVGFQLLLASTNLDTTGVLAWMIILGVLALALNLLVGAVESRALSWRPQNTGW